MGAANKIGQTRPYCRSNGCFSFVSWTGQEWISVETKHGLLLRKGEADYFGRRNFNDYDDREYFGRVAEQGAK